MKTLSNDWKSILVLSVATMVGTQAFASVPVAQVTKTDGTVAHYKMLPVHYDPTHARSVALRMEFANSTAVPASYQMSTTLLPPIRDQGQRGTCAYFATVGIVESSYIAKDSTFSSNAKVSEECLVDLRNWEFDTATYTDTDKPSARPDPNGDLPNSIVLSINKYGIPDAKVYGSGATATNCVYNQDLDGSDDNGGSVSTTAYAAATAASQAYGKTLSFNLNNAPTINAIKALIAANIPVTVGIIVYNEYMTTGNSDWRFNKKLDTDQNIAGGHAVMLTGYTTSGKSTIFTFKNSWGTTWGKAGYGTMDDAILTNAWGYDPSFDFITSVSN